MAREIIFTHDVLLRVPVALAVKIDDNGAPTIVGTRLAPTKTSVSLGAISDALSTEDETVGFDDALSLAIARDDRQRAELDARVALRNMRDPVGS